MKAYVFPGQGSQSRGMGQALFPAFPDEVRQADEILGYSIEELCLRDPRGELSLTRFTQPALYVVNALSYLKRERDGDAPPDWLLGHSLGEYNALLAAGAFDFATGLRLVKRRGELMSMAPSGGMAAVLGLDAGEVTAALQTSGLDLDVANYNSPTQTVISGSAAAIAAAEPVFERLGATFITLNVSAAFHSRAMQFMVEEFAALLAAVAWRPHRTPVVANVTARPHAPGEVAAALAAQICGPVRWTESIRYLMGRGLAEVAEIGPGKVLSSLVKVIRTTCEPLVEAPAGVADPAPVAPPAARAEPPPAPALGSAAFRRAHGLDHAYVAQGLRRPQAVSRAAAAGLLGVLETEDTPPEEVRRALAMLRAELPPGAPYAVAAPADPTAADAVADLARETGVPILVVAAGAAERPAVVRFRLAGAGLPGAGGQVMARLARVEAAAPFLAPPAPEVTAQLIAAGAVSPAQAAAASRAPLASALIADGEASLAAGGPPVEILAPVLVRMCLDAARAQPGSLPLAVGACGEIGTPHAIAAAFALGAGFVVTTAVNACGPESGFPESVQQALQALDLHDSGYAPTADGFETGGRALVMARGGLFHARANRLHEIWRRYGAWDDAPAEVRGQLERHVAPEGFEAACRAIAGAATASPKARMAAVFKRYLRETAAWARAADPAHRADYQVRVGPGLAAFNRWAAGGELEAWPARRVDRVGRQLMDAAAALVQALPLPAESGAARKAA
jgi:trans-AT polyketide synthase/acyltransferase/oxidoreductase domain-containing protein